MQACIQSFLEAFSLFLVFSVQTKPNKMLHLNASQVVANNNNKLFNAEIHLRNSNWFDRLCFFFFCRLNSLVQIEVFDRGNSTHPDESHRVEIPWHVDVLLNTVIDRI